MISGDSCLEEVKEWLDTLPGNGRLPCFSLQIFPEKLHSSHLHKFKDAYFGVDKNGAIYCWDHDDEYVSLITEDFVNVTSDFIIQHNWPRVMGMIKDSEIKELWEECNEVSGNILAPPIMLPYDFCCFEFRYYGKTLLCFCSMSDSLFKFEVYVECRNNNWFGGRDVPNGLEMNIFNQISGACAALEAEVAVNEIIRASFKLNARREKRGRLPLMDYHIVRVNKSRSDGILQDLFVDRKSPRLHFRRGHWRHYNNHKVWIKWTLVGDPDLGFIDKEYRL